MFTSFFIFGAALSLGLRHGIDWDHIAAITDITTSSQNKKESLFLGAMYAFGHGLVIIVLGLSAVALGVRLPLWVDTIMQPFVGVTLILLGIYLAFSIIRHGKNVRLRSRWMLLFATATRMYDFVERKVTHKHSHHHFHYPNNFGPKTAFIVGIVHGIGAETPTQILLFIAASNAGGAVLGGLLVITFVLGLIISNTVISLLSVYGVTKAKENATIYLVIAGITAIFSLVVGSIFLFGKAPMLPVIIHPH